MLIIYEAIDVPGEKTTSGNLTISASSYSYVSLLKYFLPMMNHGKKKILPILWVEMNSKAKLLYSGQYEWSYAKSLLNKAFFVFLWM